MITPISVKITRIAMFALGFLAFLIAFQTIRSSKAHAVYDGGRIIDNSVFLDANSMNASQIQSFLTSKGAGLANMSFTLNCYGSDSKERQWYTSVGAPCDQSIPASHIIYYASQIYGVNPKVVLATMQKEQSLTTAPNPTSWQINQAMGYACPTSGNCGGSSTFPYQIDSGVWVLRYHFERARGNMSWWNQSSSWTCGTEKNYYKPSLHPGQDVRFYDQNNVHYRTHYIQNAATSSFYCYTPHAYNNPQGLYGRAPYGTTGMYYSGSYNFVYFYELWFDSTFAPSFGAEYVRQSPYQIVNRNETRSIYFDFKNTGTAFWKDDTSTFPGYYPVRLAATNPINRWSDFRHSSWINGSRPTGVFSKVFEADGVTLATDQHTVLPNQIARFEFTISGNDWIAGGVYKEYFQPILEGSSSWSMGAWAHQDIGVHVPIYTASYFSQSSYPTIPQGESRTVQMSFRNSGNEPWYDTSSAPIGKYPVRLASTWPINRFSSFGWLWPSTARPSVEFRRVYEANGTTLSSNQEVVNPGQVAQFEFALTSPTNQPPGFYQEYFQPILEGAPGWSWNMGASAWMGITIPEPVNQAQFVSQSNYPTIRKGESAVAFFRFKNSGNTVWYDERSLPSGKSPIRLATSWPINRESSFGSSWSVSARPSTQLSAVFESDGVTLASDQQRVLPNQIAQFQFQLSVPSNHSTGNYQEYFQPILEGAPGWSWNLGSAAWIQVTVTN